MRPTEYSLISNYQHNEVLRKSFNQLATDVFGINFEEWYQRGFWDENYICHSLIKNQEVIANVSVSKMNLLINGSHQRAIQIGTVMTHPDYRGNGFSKALMNHVLETYCDDYDIFYLFANNTVHDFYPKYGFAPYVESQFSIGVATPMSINKNELRKIDCNNEEDLKLLTTILQARTPISNQFGISEDQGIFMFYALNVFQDDIYLVEEQEAIVIYQYEGNIIHLFDVVSQHQVDLMHLLTYISNMDTEFIHFHFTPDRFIEKVNYEPKKHSDLLFIRSKHKLSLNVAFCAPFLSHA